MPLAPSRRSATRAAALASLLALPVWAVAPVALGQSAQPANDAAEAEAEAAPDVDAVVATVDGTRITLGEIILMRANLPEQYQSIPDPQLFEALVQQAVNQALLAEAGRAAGADDTPLARIRATVDARNYLAEAGLRGVIEDATSDDALRAAYASAMEGRAETPEVRASHILVSERALADDLKAQLDAGADFAELAAEHGADGASASGGDLGWFAQGQMVAPFAEAAFAAEEGVVAGPVQTQFGWHLILVTGKRAQPAPTFEEMRPDLARQAASAAADAAIAAAREGAEITRPEAGIDPSAVRRDDLLLD